METPRNFFCLAAWKGLETFLVEWKQLTDDMHDEFEATLKPS